VCRGHVGSGPLATTVLQLALPTKGQWPDGEMVYEGTFVGVGH
jgi:hypothetical protein